MKTLAALTLLTTALFCGTAAAQLPGVAAARLEQAPKPNPAAPLYRQTGEQYRSYDFPGTGESIPYRLFVPESWAPGKKLPVLVTLRAGNSINNNHRGGNELVQGLLGLAQLGQFDRLVKGHCVLLAGHFMDKATLEIEPRYLTGRSRRGSPSTSVQSRFHDSFCPRDAP